MIRVIDEADKEFLVAIDDEPAGPARRLAMRVHDDGSTVAADR
jgi:hypothetical protein